MNFASGSGRHLVQAERVMHRAGGVFDAGLVHGHGDLDFRGGDHADVDARVAEGFSLLFLLGVPNKSKLLKFLKPICTQFTLLEVPTHRVHPLP